MKCAAVGLLSLLATLPVWAQPDPVQGLPSASAEYQRIAAERARASAMLDEQEAACYGRFAVNACLEEVLSGRRARLADLKRQEASLHDAERLKKGAERLHASEQRALDQQQHDRDADEATAVSQQRLQGQQEQQADHLSPRPSNSNGRAASPSRAPTATEQATQRDVYAAKQAQAENKRQEIAKRLKEKAGTPVRGLPVTD